MANSTALKKLSRPENGHWLFGSAYNWSKDILGYLENECPRHDGIFLMDSPFKNIAVVYNPDYVKYILQDNNKNYHKSFGYDVVKLLLGNGLLTSEGEFWRKQRRMAQPAFHRQKLADLTDIMTGSIARYREQFLQKIETEKELDISLEMMALTLDIVASSLFETDVSKVINVVSENLNIANEAAIERIRNPFKPPIWIPTPTNIAEKKSVKALDDVMHEIIEKRRGSTKDHADLLGMLMDAVDEDTGDTMDDRQLRDECMTIFLAGHETTALALTWLLYSLTQNPEVEAKLREEIETVVGDRTPKFEDVPKLDYTRCVIEETLRLYPPAYAVGRKTIEEDEVGGYHIPKGLNMIIPVYLIHKNEAYWADPLKFDPTRFTRENAKGRHKFVYFPFGGGPRLCIGNNFAIMEMQLALAMLLPHINLKYTAANPPVEDPLITMRPKGGLPLKVIKK